MRRRGSRGHLLRAAGAARAGHRAAEHLGEAVDVLARALLGDRHQQAVPVLLVVGAERVAGVDALLRAALD